MIYIFSVDNNEISDTLMSTKRSNRLAASTENKTKHQFPLSLFVAIFLYHRVLSKSGSSTFTFQSHTVYPV